MNKIRTIIVAVGLTAASAFSQSSLLSYTINTVSGIPDGNPVGLSENINVSGLSGTITNVTLTLDITGGFNGDLYAYLVSPLGQMTVLLNRAGLSAGNPIGYGDAGFNITLDGSLAGTSSADIHNYQGGSYTLSGGRLTGTWAADGRNISPGSSGTVFDGALRTAGLDIYNGLNGGDLNGAWTLFIADLSTGGTATLNQAILTMTVVAVPEPQTWVILGGGLATLLLLRRRK